MTSFPKPIPHPPASSQSFSQAYSSLAPQTNRSVVSRSFILCYHFRLCIQTPNWTHLTPKLVPAPVLPSQWLLISGKKTWSRLWPLLSHRSTPNPFSSTTKLHSSRVCVPHGSPQQSAWLVTDAQQICTEWVITSHCHPSAASLHLTSGLPWLLTGLLLLVA